MFLGSFHMLERSKCSVRNNFPSFNGTTTKLSWLQNCCLLTETARRARKVCLWWWVKNTSYTHPDTFPQFSQPKKTLFQMFRYVFSPFIQCKLALFSFPLWWENVFPRSFFGERMFKFSGLRPNVVFMQLHKQQQQQCEPADIAAASSFSRRCLFAFFVLVCHRARNGLWASRYARSRNTKSKPNLKLYIQQCSGKPPLGVASGRTPPARPPEKQQQLQSDSHGA